MRSEYDANLGMAVVRGRENRTDWPMRQFVDEIADDLRRGAGHDDLSRRMSERGVPVEVQRRVLAGGR